MLYFLNDYSEGAHEKVLQHLIDTNMEQLPGYGTDHYCEEAKEKIKKACGCEDAEVFLLTGGTQTNQIVIDTMLQPYEGVVAAQTGHVSTHEAGAIEFTGHKVLTLPEKNGKICAADLKNLIETFYGDENHEHMVFPGMVYISHPTEYGTLYTKKELTELSAVCKEYKIPLFMDGARLIYGLVSKETDVTLQDIAKLCDVFYIGGTKAGALCGEAVVFTGDSMPKHFLTRVKQHGALLAKGRLTGVQFDALFTDGLGMEMARHADSEADRIIREANQIEKNFRATRRTEDFLPVAAELLVNGKNGGYIDFGVHPEYSSFGEQGQQAFTVEFWVKLTDVDEYLNSFVFLLSTFTDDDTKDHERKGWAVNSHFGRLRMTYGIGYSDLFEPGFSFSTLNQWVHVAVVTNENGVDGEVRDGIPVMTKIYVNGQLMLSERGRDDRLPYTPNDKEVAMVAFTGLSATANRIGEKSTNGCMRHLHIWKSAKTQAEIQHLMDTPESVTGSESDLVCGWTLNKTVSDNNNIKDLTGKFSARLIGDFQWVENR